MLKSIGKAISTFFWGRSSTPEDLEEIAQASSELIPVPVPFTTKGERKETRVFSAVTDMQPIVYRLHNIVLNSFDKEYCVELLSPICSALYNMDEADRQHHYTEVPLVINCCTSIEKRSRLLMLEQWRMIIESVNSQLDAIDNPLPEGANSES